MPPLTIETASALCGGVPPAEEQMQAKQPGALPATLRVKVLRPFQDHQRRILQVGAEAELPRVFALEMQAANKVRVLPPQEPPKEPEKKTIVGEIAPEMIVAGSETVEVKAKSADSKKGDRDAR